LEPSGDVPSSALLCPTISAEELLPRTNLSLSGSKEGGHATRPSFPGRTRQRRRSGDPGGNASTTSAGPCLAGAWYPLAPCPPPKACPKVLHTQRSACGAGSLIRHSEGTPRPRAGSTELTLETFRAQDALNCSVPSGPRFLVVGPRGVGAPPGPSLCLILKL
jgi:hypothetical protein